MNRSTSRSHTARTVASILALVLATFMAWIPSASAYQHVGVSGQPGSVQAFSTIGVHHKVVCPVAGWSPCYAPGLVVQGPDVYRSPASTGTQYVTAYYFVYHWDGGAWVETSSKAFSGTIATGQNGVALPDWSYLPRNGGYLATGFAIEWSDGSGRVLATSVIAMNGDDYSCTTRFPGKCTAFTGYVGVFRP